MIKLLKPILYCIIFLTLLLFPIHASAKQVVDWTGGKTYVANTRIRDLKLGNTYIQRVINGANGKECYVYTHDITFVIDNGKEITLEVENNTDLISKAPVAQKTGWTFVGWRSDKSANNNVYSKLNAKTDTTMYAVFSRTIELTLKGGDKEVSNKTTQIYNNGNVTNGTVDYANITLTTNSSKYDWTLLGYRDDTTATASVSYAANQTYKVNTSKTIYAVFSHNYDNTKTITLNKPSVDANGGSVTINGSAVTKQVHETYTTYYNNGKTSDTTHSKPSVTISGNWTSSATRDYYNFSYYSDGTNGCSANGTNLSASLDVNYDSNTSYTPTAKANWSATTYTISYLMDGGSLSNMKETYTVEDSSFTIGVPTRDGFIFTGWKETTTTGWVFADGSVTFSPGTAGTAAYAQGVNDTYNHVDNAHNNYTFTAQWRAEPRWDELNYQILVRGWGGYGNTTYTITPQNKNYCYVKIEGKFTQSAADGGKTVLPDITFTGANGVAVRHDYIPYKDLGYIPEGENGDYSGKTYITYKVTGYSDSFTINYSDNGGDYRMGNGQTYYPWDTSGEYIQVEVSLN